MPVKVNGLPCHTCGGAVRHLPNCETMKSNKVKKVSVANELVLQAILKKLQQPIKPWQLVNIYNTLAHCTVLEAKSGEIQCDEDDAKVLEKL